MILQSVILILLIFYSFFRKATEILIEAESFTNKGGWVVDQQFMDQMGSLLSFIYNTICFRLSIMDYLLQIVCEKVFINARRISRSLLEKELLLELTYKKETYYRVYDVFLSRWLENEY